MSITDEKFDIRVNPFTGVTDYLLIELEENTIPAASPFHIQPEEIAAEETPSSVRVYQTDTFAEAVDDSEVGIDVALPALWEIGDILFHNDEQMLVSNKVASTLTVTRGYGGTTPIAHDNASRFRKYTSWTEVYTAPSAGEFQVNYGTTAVPYKKGLIRFHEDNAEVVVQITYYGTGHGNEAEHINDLQTWMNNLVSQSKLKTSIGSVSVDSGATSQDGETLSNSANFILPGGTYGFYPQTKGYRSGGVSGFSSASILLSKSIPFDYTTNIFLLASITSGGTHGHLSRTYSQQRYVTASGLDPWMFILYDKKENKIISTYYAPDHPSYGQGGDEKEIPHPFADYLNKKLPDNLEIILVDLAQTKEIGKKATLKRSVSEIIVEEFGVDASKDYKFTKRDISNDKGEHRFIETIPAYIKVRKLKTK